MHLREQIGFCTDAISETSVAQVRGQCQEGPGCAGTRASRSPASSRALIRNTWVAFSSYFILLFAMWVWPDDFITYLRRAPVGVDGVKEGEGSVSKCS